MTAKTRDADTTRVPLWRNVTVLKWLAQIATVAVVVLLFMWLFGNFSANQEGGTSPFSFRFLNEPAGFQLGEGFTLTPESGAQALMVGIVNTFKVALLGILMATLLGVIVGISRLSSNWLVAKFATSYVEFLRNIPLLVQMVFWLALLTLLGKLTADTGPIPGFLITSSKGVAFAFVVPAEGFFQWLLFVVAGIVAARYVKRWRRRLRDETGNETHELSWALGTFVAIAGVGLAIHPLVGPLRHLWGALESFFVGLPVIVFQVVLAVVALLAAALWIRRFLASLRTPAGMAKLTDDDYYRIVFAGAVGVVGAVAVFMLDEVAQTLLNGAANVFGGLESAYHAAAGWPIVWSQPVLNIAGDQGQFVTYGDGGVVFTPAFLGVFIGVTLYTSAFIGEAVRAGILSVPKGQTEAGLASGLTRTQLLRLVVLPQAFRVIIPPVGNQYLNLAKNTSLGIAVGYLEIVGVGQILAAKIGSRASMAVIWMGFYLAMSLTFSAMINWYNRRSLIVER
ncbi:MAG: ABC transporter permease subunit [Actinomycetota bacterium]|nr:ABC transporter permease subunit [Actinomycetota bacterium]